MLTRAIFSLAIFAMIFFLPWYIYTLVILAGFALYRNYAEGIVLAAVIDVLYGTGGYFCTILAVAFLLLSVILRRYIN